MTGRGLRVATFPIVRARSSGYRQNTQMRVLVPAPEPYIAYTCLIQSPYLDRIYPDTSGQLRTASG
jgi:hypothetical protein